MAEVEIGESVTGTAIVGQAAETDGEVVTMTGATNGETVISSTTDVAEVGAMIETGKT